MRARPHETTVYIEPRVLAQVARDLLAEYDALPAGDAAGNQARETCAFRALGMLRAFTDGYEAAQAQRDEEPWEDRAGR
jgi:hypothetical protein